MMEQGADPEDLLSVVKLKLDEFRLLRKKPKPALWPVGPTTLREDLIQNGKRID